MRTMLFVFLILLVIAPASRSQDVDLEELLRKLGQDGGEIGRALERLKNRESDSFAIGVLGGEGDFLEGERARAAGLHPGMSGIRVSSLLPRGLGARSGLKVNDVIVGAGGRDLARNPGAARPVTDSTPWLELVAEVESHRGKDSRAILALMRGGNPVALKIESPGSMAHQEGCPVDCPPCEEIRRAALRRLASMQERSGAFPAELNGEAGVVVATSVSGLAFLVAGSTPAGGVHAESVRRCREWLRSQSHSTSNWALAFATIFLARCHALVPDAKTRKALLSLRDDLLANQQPSGGWTHGGLESSYGELCAVGVFCLAALGELRRAGVGVAAEPISRGIEYLDRSSDGKGGVGYSDRPGQKGFGWAGLTAGAVFALHRIGLPRHPFAKKAVEYLKEHWDDLPHCHATTCYHCLAGSLAAGELGGDEAVGFRRRFRLYALAAWNGDGTAGVLKSDVGAFGLSTDRLLGGAWRTAVLSLMLSVK